MARRAVGSHRAAPRRRRTSATPNRAHLHPERTPTARLPRARAHVRHLLRVRRAAGGRHVGREVMRINGKKGFHTQEEFEKFTANLATWKDKQLAKVRQ